VFISMPILELNRLEIRVSNNYVHIHLPKG
jgi:hypothetical protein